MIVVDQLTVRFGGVKPIDNLDATLTASVAGLIGPNGAGKTTLLNVISGFVRPEKGSVSVDGVSLAGQLPMARVRSGLRRSFQTEQVVEDLSVYANLAAIADHVAAPGTMRREVETALAFGGLEQLAGELGRTLNLYQRRLVEVAKCVIGKPRLVLLDEPAAGLSDEETATLRSLVLRIPDEFGAQVLLIDHDVELIRSMCTETLVLDYGKMLALGPTDDVLARSEVRRAYLGEM